MVWFSPGPVACTGVCNAGGGGAFVFVFFSPRAHFSGPIFFVSLPRKALHLIDMGDGMRGLYSILPVCKLRTGISEEVCCTVRVGFRGGGGRGRCE